MQTERRKEVRQKCNQKIGVFLSRESDGTELSAPVWGTLLNLSQRGAGIALDEIMFDRTHLALGPMSSDTMQLNIIIS